MSDEKGVASVKFTEPPPKREARYDWTSIAKKLEKKPNEWALIFKQDKASLVTAIRIDGIAALQKKKGFEVRTANNVLSSPRVCDLYLRYVPEKDTRKA